jgi:hypothetical protein
LDILLDDYNKMKKDTVLLWNKLRNYMLIYKNWKSYL